MILKTNQGLLHVQSTWWQIPGVKWQGGRVLGEEAVIIGIHNGLTWVGPSQILRRTWTVDVVLGATVGGEVGGLMDERSSIGVITGGWGGPEGAAEVDLPELVGV